MIFRDDENFTKAHGKRRAFHKGGNSSCRQHIRQHYNIYKERCEKGGIDMSHHAVPRDVWRKIEDEKEAKKNGRKSDKKTQQQLQFGTVTGPREFTRAGILQSVTKLIATNNQVSVETVIKL
jgi:hypothetical protein